jgi:hypothetical protein
LTAAAASKAKRCRFLYTLLQTFVFFLNIKTMITKTKKVYQCEHCRKIYQVKRFAEAHERACAKNPENNRACFGCKYLNKKEYFLYYDTPLGEYTRTLNILHCSKKEIFLYPPKVERKGTYFDLGDELNEPMPKNCSEFVERDYL